MSFLPKGYSGLPRKERYQILQDAIDENGIDDTFREFAKITRYLSNNSKGEVYQADLKMLMASLDEKDCSDDQIFSYLTNRCIKNTKSNRLKQEEVRQGLDSKSRKFTSNSTKKPKKTKPRKENNTVPAPAPKQKQKQKHSNLTKLKSVMLADKFNGDLERLSFPAYISVKYDGFRSIIINGELYSRGLKVVPNANVRKCLSEILPNGMDMELCVNGSLGDTGSLLQSRAKEIESLDVYIIDWVTDYDLANNTPFEQRYQRIQNWYQKTKNKRFSDDCIQINIHANIQRLIRKPSELQAFYDKAVKKGEEGIMIRSLDAPYVQTRTRHLLKWKRHADAEGLIVALYVDHEEKKLEAFDLEWNGKTFRISSGLNETKKIEFYRQRNRLLGKLLKFSYQDISRDNTIHYGTAPRHAKILTIRDRADMS